MSFFVYLIIVVVIGIAAGYLAERKSRNHIGWFFLCLLIPICILILLALPEKQPLPGAAPVLLHDETTCPYCVETIKVGAVLCKHCGSDLSESRAV